MKTPDLIQLLAQQATPVHHVWPGRRIAPVALAGVLLSALLAGLTLGLVSTDIWAMPEYWLKLSYAALLLLLAGWLLVRLSRPVSSAQSLRAPLRSLTLACTGMLSIGLLVFWQAPTQQRMALLLGHSWLTCPAYVLLLSLPTLLLGLRVVRRLAPVRLRAAGLACGLCAGAAGALGYGLSCPETSAMFVAVWYTLGIALAGGLGYVLGPRGLRW